MPMLEIPSPMGLPAWPVTPLTVSPRPREAPPTTPPTVLETPERVSPRTVNICQILVVSEKEKSKRTASASLGHTGGTVGDGVGVLGTVASEAAKES